MMFDFQWSLYYFDISHMIKGFYIAYFIDEDGTMYGKVKTKKELTKLIKDNKKFL